MRLYWPLPVYMALRRIGLLPPPSRIARTEVDTLTVSTSRIHDIVGRPSYETAILDTRCIPLPVERYYTEGKAREGHFRWVATVSSLDHVLKLERPGKTGTTYVKLQR